MTVKELTSCGGKAAAAALTAFQRSERSRHAAEARWKRRGYIWFVLGTRNLPAGQRGGGGYRGDLVRISFAPNAQYCRKRWRELLERLDGRVRLTDLGTVEGTVALERRLHRRFQGLRHTNLGRCWFRYEEEVRREVAGMLKKV